MTDTDYAVAPGEYLAEWLEDHDTTVAKVAQEFNLQPLLLERFIEGRVELGNHLAALLQGATGIPSTTWLRHEAQYRADLARLRAEDPRTEKFAPADLPDWDGTWRTLGQDEATMRKRLATWTKADLINANVIARQREIQLAEHGIPRAVVPALTTEQLERALLDATSAESVVGCVRVDDAVRAIAALLASQEPSADDEAEHEAAIDLQIAEHEERIAREDTE